MVTLLSEIARALDKAHGLGIVHRDLKPENIFLHRASSSRTNLGALSIVLGCAECRGGNAGHDSSAPPSMSVTQRFWLRHADLLDTPQGQPIRKIVGPILVELSPEGRVHRSIPTNPDNTAP